MWVIEYLVVIMLKSALPMFSSKIFIVSSLMFKSLMHFEFIFVYDVRKFYFHSTTCRYPVSPALLIEEVVFSPFYILASFVKDKMSVGASAPIFLAGKSCG